MTTHIFDPNDPHVNPNAVFGFNESLLAEFKHVDDPDRIAEFDFGGPFYEVQHDLVLAAN